MVKPGVCDVPICAWLLSHEKMGEVLPRGFEAWSATWFQPLVGSIEQLV